MCDDEEDAIMRSKYRLVAEANRLYVLLWMDQTERSTPQEGLSDRKRRSKEGERKGESGGMGRNGLDQTSIGVGVQPQM